MVLPENDLDHVLIKSDGIPPYAFAQVCDDHFMRVTTVTRDDSYISSVPYHLELWNACGFKAPKFAHLLPLNIKDGESITNGIVLSKRHSFRQSVEKLMSLTKGELNNRMTKGYKYSAIGKFWK